MVVVVVEWVVAAVAVVVVQIYWLWLSGGEVADDVKVGDGC